MGRQARVVRTAVQHAWEVGGQAAAVNSCLMAAPAGPRCDFMMVLDCDMIVHPDYLLRTLGHF
jgi:hypothetical protein